VKGTRKLEPTREKIDPPRLEKYQKPTQQKGIRRKERFKRGTEKTEIRSVGCRERKVTVRADEGKSFSKKRGRQRKASGWAAVQKREGNGRFHKWGKKHTKRDPKGELSRITDQKKGLALNGQTNHLARKSRGGGIRMLPREKSGGG